MPKGNVYALRRSRPKTITRVIDPGDGCGEVFPITLRTPTSMDAFAISDKIAELVAMYVPDESGQVQIDLPPLGDEPVEITRAVAQFVAQLSVLQDGPEQDRYTDVELILMCASDMGVAALQRLLEEVGDSAPESASPLLLEESGSSSSGTVLLSGSGTQE